MPKRSPSTYILNGYAVRESTRAKRLSIRVSRAATVEIVAPCGYPKKRILAFLADKQGWIDQTLHKVETKQRSRPQEAKAERPTKVLLNAIPETWTITYQSELDKDASLSSPHPLHLVISGNVNHLPTCHYLLQRWVRQKAQKHLPQWLATVSKEIGLSYTKVSVRRQKTLWASCSSKLTISLNDKLMFLPFPLVRYILIHELCHTVHMNHSEDFWALVGTKAPDYRTSDKAMQDAWKYVPDWLTTKG